MTTHTPFATCRGGSFLFYQVFISHSNHDARIAEAVQEAIERADRRCWIAPRDIQAGQSWAAAVFEAIEASRVMVVIVTRKANESRQVIREIERAVAKGVIIVPFRTENFDLKKEFEYFLSAAHWFDATSAPLEPHLAELSKTLTAILESRSSVPRASTTSRHSARRLRWTLISCLGLVAAIIAIFLWRPWDTRTAPKAADHSSGNSESKQTEKTDDKAASGRDKWPTELVHLRSRARVAVDGVKTLDRGQGFAAQLDASSTMVETGDEFYRQHAYDEATKSYEQLLVLCDELKFKQRQRQAAMLVRDKALSVQKDVTAYAIHSLFDDYNEGAVTSLQAAAADFAQGEFSNAELAWRAAEWRFEAILALCSANDELRKTWLAMYTEVNALIQGHEKLREKIEKFRKTKLGLELGNGSESIDKKTLQQQQKMAIDFDQLMVKTQRAVSISETYSYTDMIVRRALFVSFQQAKKELISQQLDALEMVLEAEELTEAIDRLRQVDRVLRDIRSTLIVETYRDEVLASWVAELSESIGDELTRVRSILASYDTEKAYTLKTRLTRLVDDASRIPQTQHVSELLNKAKSLFVRATFETKTEPLKLAFDSYGRAIESAIDDAYQLSIRSGNRDRSSLQDDKLRRQIRARMLNLSRMSIGLGDKFLTEPRTTGLNRQQRIALQTLRLEMDKLNAIYSEWGDPNDDMTVKDNESMVRKLSDELDDILATAKPGEPVESVAQRLANWGRRVLRAADFLNPIGPPENGFEF